MRRLIVILLAVVLAACAEAHMQDIDTETRWIEFSTEDLDVSIKVPDSIEVFQNVDSHPNIARICIDGVAFLTTTRDLDAIDRVPEWDSICAAELDE